MMKHATRFLLAAIALVFLFGGCQKEGVFNPNKKISKIWKSSISTYSYYDSYDYTWETETNYQAKYLSEQWTWDGNKLSRIDHYDSDGDINYIETFSYDGKRLSSITVGGDDIYTFTYDGNKLAKMENIYKNKLYSTAIFSHNDNKISSVQLTYYDNDYKGSDKIMPTSICRFLFPNDAEKMATTLQRLAANAATKGDIYNISFEWDGDNVKRFIEGNFMEEYNYDKKKNPYHGLLAINNFEYCEILSANNVTRAMEIGAENDVIDFTYTYDGKWPITREYTSSYSSDTYRRKSTYTTYYEYK